MGDVDRDLGGPTGNLPSSATPMEPLSGVSTKGFDQAQDERYTLSDLTFEECKPCAGTGCHLCGGEGVLPVWECEQ